MTMWLVIIVLLLLIMGYYSANENREGFTWNQHLTQQFLDIQSNLNPSIVFDPEEIRRQATEKELEYFIKHKKWPWSKNTENLYIDALNRNPYIRTFPEDAINTVRSIYNERAILELLSWQTKEGNFLLRGIHIRRHSDKGAAAGGAAELLPSGWGEFAFNSGQLSSTQHLKHDPIYKCAYDKDGNISMSKVYYQGENKITGIRKKKYVSIANEDLENTIPGFEFLQSPCNPCEALNKDPNYNCPFTIETAGTVGGTSAVWKYLWGM